MVIHVTCSPLPVSRAADPLPGAGCPVLSAGRGRTPASGRAHARSLPARAAHGKPVAQGRPIFPAPASQARAAAGVGRYCGTRLRKLGEGPAGEVAERSKAAVLKTAGRESVPWVRIPPSPPEARQYRWLGVAVGRRLGPGRVGRAECGLTRDLQRAHAPDLSRSPGPGDRPLRQPASIREPAQRTAAFSPISKASTIHVARISLRASDHRVKGIAWRPDPVRVIGAGSGVARLCEGPFCSAAPCEDWLGSTWAFLQGRERSARTRAGAGARLRLTTAT